MAKAVATIELFAGIFDEEGRLLVRKRQPEEKTFAGEWELPGRALNYDEALEATDERAIRNSLIKAVLEKTGIEIDWADIDAMPAMYPAIQAGRSAIAFLIVIGEYWELPSKGEWRYVNTNEFLVLCNASEGDRITGGLAGPMCRLGLKAMALSPSEKYSKQAEAARKRFV